MGLRNMLSSFGGMYRGGIREGTTQQLTSPHEPFRAMYRVFCERVKLPFSQVSLFFTVVVACRIVSGGDREREHTGVFVCCPCQSNRVRADG